VEGQGGPAADAASGDRGDLAEDAAPAGSEDAPAPAVTADETAAPAKAPAKVSSVPLPVTVFARRACVAGVV